MQEALGIILAPRNGRPREARLLVMGGRSYTRYDWSSTQASGVGQFRACGQKSRLYAWVLSFDVRPVDVFSIEM